MFHRVGFVFVAISLPVLAQNAAYRTVSDWGAGFNGEIVIANAGTSAVEGWQVEFDWDRALDPVWNATLLRHEGSHWVLGPEEWNGKIAAGGQVVIGFSGTPGRVNGAAPQNIKLTATGGSGNGTPALSPVKLAWLVSVKGDTGFSGAIIITNEGAEPVPDWTLAFEYEATIDSVWNAGFDRSGRSYVLVPAEEARVVPPGGAVVVGYTAQGTPPAGTPAHCRFNGAACEFLLGADSLETPASPAVPGTALPPPATGAISISTVDDAGEAPQLAIAQGTTRFRLSSRAANPQFTVAVNNPRVVTAKVTDGNVLELTGIEAGRSALRIVDSASNVSRYAGVAVRDTEGRLPGLPSHLAIGSVSEDTAAHLDFWRGFDEGDKGRRVDYRYIYLNGGPVRGWATWSALPGGRATGFIRNSRMLGIIPVFVFYNIPQDSESAQVAITNSRDRAYMTAWFQNLSLLIDIIRRESPDDPVGIVLEPDFLGYLAQQLKLPPSQIPAATGAAYESGLLTSADPRFPDTLRGLVETVNHTISTRCAQCFFGWQMNLWASPAGGWRTPIPAKGIIHVTDEAGMAAGREKVRAEAGAIASFYAEAGIATHGARFFSVDKYGLDAVGAEPFAGADPGASTWFWNADHWGNYLTFVRTAGDTLGLPAVLWQIPVGRINRSQADNPYAAAAGARFPDLTNGKQSYEDSAPSWFFGDRFIPGSAARRDYFATNRAADTQVSSSSDTVTWGPHLADAADAGITAILFGAGVADSTSGVGSPAGDGYWWIVKAQRYLNSPVKVRTK